MALKFSSVITAHRKVHSDGFSYDHLNERSFGGIIDPILSVDHFRMSERPFPSRPLAGFTAVTTVFEKSEGGFTARDHLGLDARIPPGGFYGLVSGSGMIAEETPFEKKTCEGIHVSINLSSIAKRLPPWSFTLDPSEVKEWRPNPRLRGRVFLGKLAGAESSIVLPSPFSFFEFEMMQKMSVSPRVLAESGGLLYVLRGKLRLSSGDGVISLDPRQAVGFASAEQDLELLVESLEESRFLFLSGKSCREPIVSHGAFVMNSQEGIADAIRRYHSGDMGKLSASED